MHARRLPNVDGPLMDEAIWEMALAFSGRGSLNELPILLSELRARLDLIPDNSSVKSRDGLFMDRSALALLQRRVHLLLSNGTTQLPAPWPVPDREIRSGWVWESYSDERLFERTKAIYQAALEGYGEIVGRWFPSLANRLETKVMMPARLTGWVRPADPGKGYSGSPIISWRLEPLPLGSRSAVELRMGEGGSFDSDFLTLWENTRRLRPDAAEWIGAAESHGMLNVFGAKPATELVYGWLWDDQTPNLPASSIMRAASTIKPRPRLPRGRHPRIPTPWV